VTRSSPASAVSVPDPAHTRPRIRRLRAYTRDDLRTIDWNVNARLREVVKAAPPRYVDLALLLDGSRRWHGPPRFRYAQQLGAMLARRLSAPDVSPSHARRRRLVDRCPLAAPHLSPS